MTETKRLRPTYGGIVGTLALVVACGGTGYAAGLAKNSVKSETIANGNVRTVDLDDDAVTSDKIKNGSIKGADIKDGVLPELPAGTLTDFGLTTPYDNGSTLTFSVNANETTTGTQSCPEGKVALGGGVYSVLGNVTVLNDFPAYDGTGWSATVKNNDDSVRGATIFVTCAKVVVSTP